MASHKISLSLSSFALLSILIMPSSAQNSAQDYVSSHNTPRGQVGVSTVTWDTTLANYALDYAKKRIGDCALIHSNGTYGENLAKGNGTFTGVAAVNLWVAEKQYYNYTSNSCIGTNQCLHYTQVVWHDSIHIGCAKVQCMNAPGNWEGEWPY